MLRVCIIHLLLMISLLQGSTVLASHPTEGVLSLDSLIQEALASNPEIKSSEANLQVVESQYKSTWGEFTPEISLEGGPLTTKFDNENVFGTAAYGKAEWNLYRGGKDAATVSKKKIEKNLAQKQLDQMRAKVAREVARVYYEMAFLLESISIKEKALELNKEQAKLAAVKKSAGFTSEADVIEFDLREATLQSDLKELQQERQSKSRELSVLLGRADISSELAVKGHLEKSGTLPDKHKFLQSIDELNPEIIEAKANLEISKEEKVAARSSFFPKLDIHAKYGRLANEERVLNDNNNYSVGVTINIPLFSGFSSMNEFSSATAQTAKAEAQFVKQALATKAAADTLYSKLETTLGRLALEEKTLLRSEQYYKVTLGEYRRGVKNSPDMVGATERLLNSRIRNLEFRRDYQLSFLQLLALAGAAPNDSNSFFGGNRLDKRVKHEKVLKSGEVFEECMKLQNSQELNFSYNANSPVDFNIHFHEGKNISYPIKQDQSQEYEGFLKTTSTQDYCLMWTNIEKHPVTISYEFIVK